MNASIMIHEYGFYKCPDCWSSLVRVFCCRCLGILLQKVHDRIYVRAKIDLMYKQANISFPKNRLGLAKAMGLVSNFKLRH